MSEILDINGNKAGSKPLITDEKGSALIQEKKKQEVTFVKSDAPLLTSEEMDITPIGSIILARGFKAPETTKGGIILKKESDVLPCLEVMKVGNNVKVVQEGKWILLRAGLNPPAVPYKDELFFMFQETDVIFMYDKQPDIDHIMQSDTTIRRDLTEYVKYDKMSKVRAKITEGMEGASEDEE